MKLRFAFGRTAKSAPQSTMASYDVSKLEEIIGTTRRALIEQRMGSQAHWNAVDALTLKVRRRRKLPVGGRPGASFPA